MPFVGKNNDIIIEIPNEGNQSWYELIRNECFLKLVEHDHTGNGKGRPLGASSLLDNSITTNKLQNSSVTTDKVNNAAITEPKIDDNAISTRTIQNNAITNSKVADNAIDDAKILLRNDQFLRGRNADDTADIDIVKINTSNQVEFAGTVTATPAVDSVGTAQLQNNAVNANKIDNNAIETRHIADSSINDAKLSPSTITKSKLDSYSVSAIRKEWPSSTTAIALGSSVDLKNTEIFISLTGSAHTTSNILQTPVTVPINTSIKIILINTTATNRNIRMRRGPSGTELDFNIPANNSLEIVVFSSIVHTFGLRPCGQANYY